MRVNIIFLAVMLSWGTAVSMAQTFVAPCGASSDMQSDPALKSYQKEMCAATEPFKKLETAVARGYRMIGPDTPHMGQHWINLKLALRGKLDLSKPAVLTYLTIDDEPVLTGVAYIIDYSGGLPDPPPVPGATWHYHTGSLEAELIQHTDHHDTAATAGVAMFHAWLWSPNPDGLFEADNWYLPHLKAKWEVAVQPAPAASRALALMQSGSDYYEQLIDYALRNSDVSSRDYADILRRYREEITRRLAGVKIYDAALQADLTRLWQALWEEMEVSMSESQWRLIAPLAN